MSDVGKHMTATATVEEGQIYRLVLARILLREAERFVDHDTPALQSLALLPLQDAVELVLRVVGTKHQAKDEQSFDTYLSSVESAVGRPLPLRTRMVALNKARVLLKHHGVPADRDAVRRFAQEATTFIREVSREFLDLSFDDVSIADFIRNPKVSREIKSAERSFEAGEYSACVEACAVGFAFLTERLAKDPRWAQRLDIRGLRSRNYDETPDIRKLKDSAADAIEALERHSRLFGLLASGIDLSDYWDFTALTPRVSVQWGNASPYGQRKSVESNEARFCLNYFIKTALSVQGRHGGIFTKQGTSLRATKESELLACMPLEGQPPDVVAYAHPGDLLIYDGPIATLKPGEIIPVIHWPTAAVLWIDAGALAFDKDSHHGDEEDPRPPTK